MISLSHVTVNLGGGNSVLQDVSLDVKPGEFVFITGASGAGKTTLLRLLYFDLLPTAGEVRMREFTSASMTSRYLPQVRRHLGVVFQDFKLLYDRTVFENVAVSLYVSNTPKKKIRQRTLDALAEAGIGAMGLKKPENLSSGEQQRVAIARALVNEPFVLIADEPTGNLDPATAREIVLLLQAINHRGAAVVMTTHDYDLIALVPAARIVSLANGKLLEGTLHV